MSTKTAKKSTGWTHEPTAGELGLTPGTGQAPCAPLAFVDLETDGVHPDRKPWEIAILQRDSNGVEQVWVAFIGIDLSTADPFGLRVGGFYDRHPQGRYLAGLDERLDEDLLWSLDAVAIRTARLTHGAHIVGAVPSFDTGVLDPLLRSQSAIPAWHYHFTDVENLAVGYLAGQGTVLFPPWSSTDLSTALGVAPPSPEERHTALGDTLWAVRMWDRIMGTSSPLAATRDLATDPVRDDEGGPW